VILNPHAKLLWHGDRVKDWLEGNPINPILVEIAPTGYCNASCPWCFFKSKLGSERIDTQTMLRTLSELAVAGAKAINWTGGGEPTLHPDFEKFVERAAQVGLKQGLFTNALKEIPCQEHFEWIRVSMTDKGYPAMKKPYCPFGINVNHTESQTEAELRALCLEARNMGASYFQIRPALVGCFKIQPHLKPLQYLHEYDTADFSVYTTEYKYADCILDREYSKCYGFNFCPSINWKNKLGVCLYMMEDERFILGDLKEQSFSGIWSEAPSFVNVVPECQNCCKNHEINKILFTAKNIQQIEFL